LAWQRGLTGYPIVELGRSYPGPIIDHKQARERVLAAYAKLRAS
jgi:deoxyribodipyrimidine photolyase